MEGRVLGCKDMVLLSWKQISSQDAGLDRDRSRKTSQRLWKSSQPQKLVSYNVGARC